MNENSLVKNSIYNVFYRCLNIVFPLITSIYIARILMAESIGKIAAAQNLVSYFTLLAAMGIPTYGTKIVAQYRVKSKESEKAFTELFLINFLLSLICSIIYFSIIMIAPHYAENRTLYCVTGLNILFNIINVDWFYQGVQEYKYIAYRSLLIKCLSLVAIFIFVRTSDDYIIYALISTGALIGNYLFNIIRIRNYVSLYFNNLTFKEHLRHIATLMMASIAAEIYVLADTTMLDYMCGSTIVGYYNMSMQIIKIIRGVVTAVAAVFLPQFSKLYSEKRINDFHKLINQGMHAISVISIPVAIGIILTSEDIIFLLFGDSFKESVLTTRILAVSIISVAFSSFIGLQVLVTIGKERITTISTCVGAIINIIMNYYLIRLFMHNGAAVASATTEIAVTLIQLSLARKYIPFDFKLKKTIYSTIVMIVFVIAVRLVIRIFLLRIIVEVLVGILSYTVMMVIQKDDFAMYILKILKRWRGYV